MLWIKSVFKILTNKILKIFFDKLKITLFLFSTFYSIYFYF